MEQKYGYFGQILWVDLSSGTIEKEAIPDQFYEDYIGGYALGAKILFDRMPPKSDPLGPNNIIGFLPGLFTGSSAPFSGRYMVVGKSPLTGTWGDSNSGGFFGPAIKKCSVDGIFFKGVAQNPVYLLYDGTQPHLLSAKQIWGLDAIDTESALKEIHGESAQVACIGTAGEKLSLISCIINNGGRAAARSGLGAVMGSKNLKAVVLNGKEKLSVYAPDRLKDIVRTYNKKIQADPNLLLRIMAKVLPKTISVIARLKFKLKVTPDLWIMASKEQGTSVANAISSETGDSPVKNWKGVGRIDFPQTKSQKISGQQFLKYKKKSYGCAACPLRCGAILSVPEIGLKETHRPEYETSCMFGTFLLNDDVLSILELNEMCNRAGMDTISTGSTIGFAMECYEKGIISDKDTGGIALQWGNAESIKTMLKKMIDRDGLGDILADGVKRASERIGKGSEEYAMHFYGQEIPAHDPKHMPSMALTYNTDPTPGRHTAADTDFFFDVLSVDKIMKEIELPRNRTSAAAKMQSQKIVVALTQVLNALGICQFGFACGRMPVFDLLEAVTGWKWSYGKFIQTGLRIQNLRIAFNLREGINLYLQELPGRITGKDPLRDGPHRNVTIDVDAFKKQYCNIMGWNPETGVPYDATLRDLGLEYVIDQIK
ncbi:MAG: aldehyde ferredoxin oxidoreductase family protein [Deltaproteobacteria bacterium]|nr:aldehyde ferredoxin oxidoreductase family protein [Deltaproteobacteria bacterium]